MSVESTPETDLRQPDTGFSAASSTGTGLLRRVRMLMRKLRWPLLVLLLLGLLHFLSRNRADLELLKRIDLSLVLAVCAAHTLLLFISSEQFFLVARHFHPSMNHTAWTETFVLSRFFNRFAPQAGNAYRISNLKLVHGFPVAHYLISLSVFSILNRLITVWCVAFGILLVEPGLEFMGLPALPVVFAIAFGGTVVTAIASFTSERWGGKVHHLFPKLFRRELAQKLTEALRDRQMLFGLVLWGIAGFVLSVGAHAICFSALGEPMSWARLGVLKFLKSTFDAVSITPGNFGVTETVYGVANSAMKDSVSAGIIVAAFLNLTNVIVTSLLGGVILLWRSFSPRRETTAGVAQ